MTKERPEASEETLGMQPQEPTEAQKRQDELDELFRQAAYDGVLYE